MHYQRCSEVKKERIYEAFKIGFSDYSVPMTLGIEAFFERFFGLEGNDLYHSFIATENEVPVGLIMGGIRPFDGYRNMRCGTLCIAPEKRGSEVSGKLFDLFVENAAANNCERLSLEVLYHNERAIRFYEKRGFQKQNKLCYYSAKAATLRPIPSDRNVDVQIVKTDLSIAEQCRKKIPHCHINWQNEAEYFSLDKTAACFAAYEKEELLGSIVITNAGKIYFLWVLESHRLQNIAKSLIYNGIYTLQLEKLSISMPDTIVIGEFLDKMVSLSKVIFAIRHHNIWCN